MGKPGARNMAAAGAALAAMAAFVWLDGQLGPLSFTLRRAVALVVLTGVAATLTALGSRPLIVEWVGMIPVMALVARAPSVPVALLAFVFGLAAIQIGARRQASAPTMPAGLVPACLAYVAIRFTFDLVPAVVTLSRAVAHGAGRYVGLFRAIELHPSSTALGGPALGLVILYLLWSWRHAGGIGRLLAAAAIPLAWFALLPAVIPDASSGPLAIFSHGAWYGAFWLGVAVVVDAAMPSPSLCSVGITPAARRRISPGLACLAATFAGVCLVGTAPLGPPTGKSIRVHNRGGLDWERPVFGKFGAFTGGMFGLLPVSCRAEGYDFNVIDKDSIDPADLKGTQILVLINSPMIWDDQGRRTIYDFVARGGSLLVLGDHTDVFGLMRGFNSLLDPLGIRFRFDSAYKAREGWRGCQAAAPDAVAWGWDEENPGVAVGASLELSGSARPLLVGRYGFSDAGVPENYVGSFLGNYHYDQGERLGDVVLVATTTVGQGRVVVWGDTTAFQGAGYYYAKVIGPMLAWLSRPAAWTERSPVRIAAACGLLAAVAWLWVVRASAMHTALIALSLLMGMVVPWGLSLRNLEAHVRVGGDTFLVDRSHFPASGHYNARVNPVGPLYTNLLRSGFRTVDMERWDPEAVARARGMAFVAPQRSFSHDEVEELLRAEEAGAVVLLTVGQPESAGARLLLEAHDLALLPKPLGTVLAAESMASRREREQQPRFLDAWPIATVSGADPAALAGVEIIYRRGEDVVALFRRRGRGGLLLISDTRFFSDMNVEDVSGYWVGNLALIHDMFHRYLGVDPETVKPLFRSPEKPQ